MPFEPRIHQPDDDWARRQDDEFRAADLAAEQSRAEAMGNTDADFSDAAWEAAALPPEFAALAEQLTADSAFLAECYPADAIRAPLEYEPVTAEVAVAPMAAPAFTLAMAGGLVGGIVAIVLLMAGLVGHWGESPNGNVTAAIQPAVEVPATPMRDRLVATFGAENVLPAMIAPTPSLLNLKPGESPVRALRQLSGPELEGLIDLLDEPSGDKPSLSI